ncbi:MAG: DNA polymerase III subunit gamma/tau [Lachnospiraceae bacterium]|nr:DNA polymerase III subunit gamma/tau [Lachnospiraceae bacterium]
MSYTAMYRKFRPQRFEDVKGQDHIVTTLRNQIRSDRIGHAYLFCGTRGTGKTSVAKLFAKAINCENPQGENPCMECASCRAIQSGASMNVIEIDAASNNGVDNIRQIVEEVQYPPAEGKYKVYIIDEVHMLSIGAFNALLKTLEEPPSYVVFILATTEVHKLPVTILSRCQRYDFKRIGVDDISARIRELLDIEKLEADDAAIAYIARSADGALRDALSLLDQCMAFNFGKRLTHEMVLDVLGAADSESYSNIVRAVIASDVSEAVGQLEKAIMDGRELSQFVVDLTGYLRNMLLIKTADDLSIVNDMSADAFERIKEEARILPASEILRYVRVFSELTNQIRYASNKRILTEIALIKLCCPQTEAKDDNLISRVRYLEKIIESGSFVKPDNEERPAKPEETAKAKPQSVVSAAAPEDIKKIVQNWRAVIDRMGSGDHIFIKDAVPSADDKGTLILTFTNPFCYAHYSRTDAESDAQTKAFEDTKAVIDSYAGRDVSIRMVLQNSVTGTEESTGSFEEQIRSQIDMDIITED